MNIIAEEQRKQYQDLLTESREKYGQFDVDQIRPDLVALMNDAVRANWDHNMSRGDLSYLGFQTQCLINYVFLLEEKMEKQEARKTPDPYVLVEKGLEEGFKPNFIRKVAAFLYNIYHRE